MNRIGIIGAMEEEVAILKEKMKIEQKLEKASMEFFAGTLAGREVVVVRSGIGKVNAGICTQILVDLFDVKAVINTGIAGSLDGRIDIGDIVISTDALHHDMDAVNFGYPLGQIPRMDTLSFPADEKLIAVAEEACRQVNPDIHTWTGRVVSGDQLIADRAVKDRIIENFGGFCGLFGGFLTGFFPADDLTGGNLELKFCGYSSQLFINGLPAPSFRRIPPLCQIGFTTAPADPDFIECPSVLRGFHSC